MTKASVKAGRNDRGGPRRARVTVSPTNTRIMRGQEDLSDWDLDELRRGRRKDKNGRFTGPGVKVVPKEMLLEYQRRLMSDAFMEAKVGFRDAIALWVEVINDEKQDMAFRLRASELLADRVMGKAAQPIYVGGADAGPLPWQQMAMKGIVATTHQALELIEAAERGEEDIVDGEVVEDATAAP